MNKIWKKILCGTLALTTLLSLTACTKETVINAYDIAVKNGYTGTEQEWLQSLHGADGNDGKDLKIEDIYAWAKEQGFEGTYLEFLQSLGLEVNEDNNTETIAQNISSTVEICCGFTRTVTETVGWGQTKSTTYASASAGSGVVYSINRNAQTATIITNYHVIYSNSMTILKNGQYQTVSGVDQTNGITDCVYVYPYGELNYFSSGDTDGDTVLDGERGDKNHGIRARVIGGAMDYDIAILETDIPSADYFGVDGMANEATLGDSNTATVGEKVFAVGNANGLGISVTSGALSVESEYIQMGKTDGSNTAVRYRVMRTDSAINHGNSGGGLYNAQGELIGITNAKNVEDETDNMGYALPITQVKYLVENMLANRTAGGYVSRAMLGIETLINSTSTVKENGKLVIKEEIIVSSAPEAGSSAYGKLSYGDVLKSVKIGNATHELTRNFILPELLLTVRNGDKITLNIVREGVAKSVEITFGSNHFVKYT